MKKEKIIYSISTIIIFFLYVLSAFLYGYGYGVADDTRNWIDFISNPYGMNITIEKMNKIESNIFIIFIFERYIKGLLLMFFALILFLITSAIHSDNKKKKR